MDSMGPPHVRRMLATFALVTAASAALTGAAVFPLGGAAAEATA